VVTGNASWSTCRIWQAAVLLLIASVLGGAEDSYGLLFRQAAEFSQQGKYQEAIGKYNAALAMRPGAAEALNNLAVMYYTIGSYARAWDLAELALKAQPGMTSAALIAGLAAVRCDRPADAIAPLEQVLRADPANRDALLGLASARIGAGQVAEAAALYEERTANAPRDADAWYGQAICYERLAETASRELSKVPGAFSYSKSLLGEFLLARGDARLAREAFGEAEEESSIATDSLEAAALYRRARELAVKSREAFSRFVALAPGAWQTHLFLGDVERQHRNFPLALEHYGKAAALQPQSPGPLLGMGTVRWELGEFDAAEESLRQALRLNPGSLQATFELANIAVRRHQDAAAVPLLEKFLEAQPDALAARADLGRAYLHLAQYEKAVDQLEKASAADLQGEIHYQLATALRKLGRGTEADAAMRVSTKIRESELERAKKRKAAQ
jgi:tetratricopeptide (TPR) repeat protein